MSSLAVGGTALLTLLMGLRVWAHSKKSQIHCRFLFFSAATSLWIASNGLVHSFSDTPWGPFWGRSAFFSASLIPISFLLFSVVFPYPKVLPPKLVWFQRAWFTIGSVLAVLSFTPLMVAGTREEGGRLVVTYGPLHVPFGVYFIGCLLAALFILNSRRLDASGIERTHAHYLLVAILIGAVGATTTNLLLPILFKTSRYGQMGVLFALPMVALIGHAIMQHRLLEVRLVVRRGAVFLVSMFIACIALLVAFLLLNYISPMQGSISAGTIAIFMVMAIALHPLRTYVKRMLNKYLQRDQYSYRSIVKESSRSLASTVDLAEIGRRVGHSTLSSLKPEVVCVYVFDGEEHVFEPVWASEPAAHSIDLSESLMCELLRLQVPLLQSDLGRFSEQRSRVMAEDFRRLNAKAIAPLVESGELLGFISVGSRALDNPYFSDDADLLATLANQSAVSIRNAQTHQRVVQLNEELQKILSTIESGVVAIGTKGKIALFNPAAELLTGVEASAARGQRVEHLPAPLATLIAGTLADRQPRSQIEFSLPDMSGQMRPLVCSTSPLESPDGRPMGAVAVLNDISILKQLEHQRRQAERLASNEAMASGLVHEIRNPLVAVKTFCQLLPSRYLDVDFRETFSRTVGREVRRIDSLLTRFRTLASVASQPMEPVDVLDPLRHTIELLRPQFDEHKITIRQVFDGTPRRVLGNTSQLEQLFLNLCLNALEAMGSGGELTLRIADLSDGGGTTLLVEISDTGDGIPDDLLPKIFDPFVSTKSRSSGLGLAICRGVADAHHARLGAKNNTDRRGATFTIEFPIPISSPATTP